MDLISISDFLMKNWIQFQIDCDWFGFDSDSGFGFDSSSRWLLRNHTYYLAMDSELACLACSCAVGGFQPEVGIIPIGDWGLGFGPHTATTMHSICTGDYEEWPEGKKKVGHKMGLNNLSDFKKNKGFLWQTGRQQGDITWYACMHGSSPKLYVLMSF